MTTTKNKFLGIMIAFLIIPLVIIFSACGGIKVEGKTYTYDKQEAYFTDDVTIQQLQAAANNLGVDCTVTEANIDEAKQQILEAFIERNAMIASGALSFGENKVMLPWFSEPVEGTYEFKDKKITITASPDGHETTFIVRAIDNKTIVFSSEDNTLGPIEGIVYKVYFKVK